MLHYSPSYASRLLRKPSFTLSIVPGPCQTYKVRLESPFTDLAPIEHTGYSHNLENNVPLLIDTTLENVQDTFFNSNALKIKPGQALKALVNLHNSGREIWLDIIGIKMLGRLWSYVRSIRSKIGNKINLRIELKAPAHWLIPIEILPLNQLPSIEPTANADWQKIQATAKELAAFSAEIRYLILPPEAVTQNKSSGDLLPSFKPIPATPSIPLLFLWCKGAPRAAEAQQYIWSLNNDVIKPKGPFPNRKSFNTPDSLAKLLIEKGNSSVNHDNDTPVRIVHVHSHGEIIKDYRIVPPGKEYRLQFCYEVKKEKRWNDFFNPSETRKVIVSKSHLSTAMLNIFVNGNQEEYHLSNFLEEIAPFIFINACHGNAKLPSGDLGLAEKFLESGYSAVIGPNVPIPGKVADYIAKHFYENLLSKTKNSTLATSILQARNDLLEEHNNPLGALYTVYGQSLLRIDWTH